MFERIHEPNVCEKCDRIRLGKLPSAPDYGSIALYRTADNLLAWIVQLLMKRIALPQAQAEQS